MINIARPKGTPKSKKVSQKDLNDPTYVSQQVNTPLCLRCGVNGKQTSFYNSFNPTYDWNLHKIPYCKECIQQMYEEFYKQTGDSELAMFYLCRKLDVYYATTIYEGANKAVLKGGSLIPSYFKTYNGFHNNANYGDTFSQSANFLDMEMLDKKYKSGMIVADNGQVVQSQGLSDEDEINKKDCIRLLGYDPFFDNDENDQKYLYNTLINFLDDATLQDAFKLPIVIEMVKSLGQVERLNKTFAVMMASAENIEENSQKIKSLIDAKDKLYRSVLAMAKDNGISVNYSNNKSQGAGTLSGMVKELDEIGLRESKINLFDSRTLGGIKQANDLSNKSILDQLALTESEYADMVKELREIRVKLENKVLELEEGLRLEKVKVSDLTDINNQMNEYIEKLKAQYTELNKSKYSKANIE
nr:MAG TPA: hypothetical protein [Caudoviricetes sp.]